MIRSWAWSAALVVFMIARGYWVEGDVPSRAGAIPPLLIEIFLIGAIAYSLKRGRARSTVVSASLALLTWIAIGILLLFASVVFPSFKGSLTISDVLIAVLGFLFSTLVLVFPFALLAALAGALLARFAVEKRHDAAPPNGNCE